MLYQTRTSGNFTEHTWKYFNDGVSLPATDDYPKDDIHSFIQDGRIYQTISLRKKKKKKETEEERQPDPKEFTYALMKIPFTKIPRFIELPPQEGNHYIMFIDDVIKANMKSVFPGYDIVDCFSIKISRDADFSLEEEDQKDIAEKILRKVRKRKIGAVTRFQYDKEMPDYFLEYLQETYRLKRSCCPREVFELGHLADLPNPVGDSLKQKLPQPLRVPELETNNSILRVLRKQDVLHFPYQSFDYLLRFLLQAALSQGSGDKGNLVPRGRKFRRDKQLSAPRTQGDRFRGIESEVR